MFGFKRHHKPPTPTPDEADPSTAPSHDKFTATPQSGAFPPIAGDSEEQQSTASELGYQDDHEDKAKTKKDRRWANRGFEQLSEPQRALIESVEPGAGEMTWGQLSAPVRAGFLNVTAVMVSNGFSLDGLRLQPVSHDRGKSGLQQDRLLFTADSAPRLRPALEAAIAEREARGDRGFIEDKPEDGLHPGMSAWGGRQWTTRFSMQIGGGPGGAFVDIDEFGPKVDVVGTIGHMFEVLRNKTKHHITDPFTVAKGLNKRGIEP